MDRDGHYAEIIEKNRENGVYDIWAKINWAETDLEDIFPYISKE